MKPCRWCAEPIAETAQRCRHCRIWQRDGADQEDVRKAQILDDGIIHWGKFMLALAGVLIAAVVAAGGIDINHAREQAWQAQVGARTAQADAERAKEVAERTALDANKVLESGRAKVSDLQKDIEGQRKYVDTQIEYISGRARSLQSDDPAHYGDNLKNQGEAISALQQQVSVLQQRLAALNAAGESAPPSVSPEQLVALAQAFRIKQVATKIGPAGAADPRQSYDIAFSLCNLAGEICGEDHADDVARVVYRFDEHWFTVADVPIANAASRFGYTVRVWGVTKVRACIFVKGWPRRPIARAGRMNLSGEPSYWGPDPSATADTCEDLSHT